MEIILKINDGSEVELVWDQINKLSGGALDPYRIKNIENSSDGVFNFSDTSQVTTLESVSKLYNLRRRREKIFNAPHLFGEPGWDILLDLFKSDLTGKKISVTSACLGGQVAITTGLRWLQILENLGLVERQDDAQDRRRSFVHLSPKGAMKLHQLLD